MAKFTLELTVAFIVVVIMYLLFADYLCNELPPESGIQFKGCVNE